MRTLTSVIAVAASIGVTLRSDSATTTKTSVSTLGAEAIRPLAGSRAVPLPSITSVSPRLTVPTGSVTITGTNLRPTGYSVELEYKRAYPASGQETTVRMPLSGTSTAIQFPAPGNMRRDGLILRYTQTQPVKDQLFDTSIPVPGTIVVVEPPVLLPPEQTITVNGQPRARFGPGTLTIKGRHLRTPVVSGASSGTTGSITSTTVAWGPVNLPITQATYDPNATLPDGSRGVDILTLTVPDVATSGTASNLTVTAHGGTVAHPNAVFIKPPTISRVVTVAGTASGTSVPPGQTLFRGREYRVEGTALNLFITGGTVQGGTLSVGGTQQQAQADSPGLIRFTLQTSASSGNVAVSIAGGSASIGPFTIANAPPTLPLSDVILAPSDVVGGNQISATVAFAGTIAAGTTAGELLIEGDGDAFAELPRVRPITSNPMVVQVETYGQTSTATHPLKFRVVPSSGGVDSLIRNVTLRQLEPAVLTLTPSTVTGGQTVSARVDVNAGPSYRGAASTPCAFPGNDQIRGSFSSSDTSAVQVPTSLCIDEGSETKQLTTRTVTSTKTVSIGVTVNGVARTATLTVLPGQITSVSVSRPTLVSLQSATGTVTVSSPLPGAGVLLSSSDPAVSVPAKITLGSGLTGTFPITTAPVSSARTVTITALVNGVTQTATLSLQPLQITNVTFAPASVAAGGNTVGTVRLNAAIDLPITVTLTSGDPAVATVPASVAFAGGQDAAIFNVQTVSPQSQSRTVTISATYSITPPGGSNVSTSQTGTVTVNP